MTPDLTPLSAIEPRSAGPYRLLGRLGQGGQGVVYLGTDAHDRRVAVKMLSIDLQHNPKAKAQFAKEIAAARRVAPFCTAQVMFAELDAELPYVVSEFIPGPTLYRQVRDHGPISDNALYRLAVGTATALAAIHQAGIVHCDFKPDNVILGADGPRVIDFGIARALGAETMTNHVMGTVPYMAPERFRNVDVGPSCDVFAWAATIAFAAAGRPPFGSDSMATVMARVLTEEPELENLTGSLLQLVIEGLDKRQQARPTAEQILLRLLGHTAVPADPMPLAEALLEGSEAATTLLPAESDRIDSLPPQRNTSASGSNEPTRPKPALRQTAQWDAAAGSVGGPAGSASAGPQATDPLPKRIGPVRRLGRQLGDPIGIATAILLGAGGLAAGYLAAEEVGIAAVVGAGTFGVVYLVRLLLAVALDDSTR